MNLRLFILLCFIIYCKCDIHEGVSNNDTLDFRLQNKNNLINKCCPPHLGIVRFDLGGNAFQYDCADPVIDNRTDAINVTLEAPLVPLIIVDKELSVHYTFPDGCDETQLSEIVLSAVKAMPEEYCIDKIIQEKGNFTNKVGDDSVVILSCDLTKSSKSLDVPSVRTVKKCCVEDMVYDTDNHMCIIANGSLLANTALELNEKLFFNLYTEGFTILDIKYGFTKCLSPKVAYEYNSEDYSFELVENQIKVSNSKKKLMFDTDSFCIDRTTKSSVVVRGCILPYRSTIPIVTKCCPEGQVYMLPNNNCSTRAMCTPNPHWGFSPDFYDVSNAEHPASVDSPKSVAIRYTPQCPEGRYLLNKKDSRYLDVETGSLLVPSLIINPMQPDYCMDVIDSTCPGRHVDLYTFICFPSGPAAVKTEKLHLSSIGLIISCVFLAATLVVYLALPALQNLHGRTIMSHVSSMLVSYSCLARVQHSFVPEHQCTLLGYAVYFSFLAAFSWLNIMCFDIWWTFGNIRAIRGMQKNKDRKKYFLFSLYAWGVPCVLTTITFLLDKYNVAPGYLDANIGQSKCWFSSDVFKYPVLILFILPVGIQIATNVVLFVLTAIHCSKVKSEIHRMQAGSMGDKCKRRFMADKAKYAMNMKLFIVMGVSWVTEIISSLFNQPYELWYVADAINVLQGIPIFVILVMKRKVYRLIRKRLGLEKPQEHYGGAATTTTGISSNSCTDPLARKYNSQISTASARTNYRMSES